MENHSDQPTEGFDDFVILSVSIKSPPGPLFDRLTDIENLSDFFPQIEFKMITDGPVKPGSIYHTRQKGSKNWSAYRVLVVEQDARMSAELTGKDPLFTALRYDHKFIVDGEYTISHERVDYTFRFGAAGRVLNFLIGKRLVRKQVLDAHKALKKHIENP